MIKEIKPRYVKLLCWFEECANHYVKLLRKPEGVEFPKELDQDELQKVKIRNLEWLLIKHAKDNIWRSWEFFSDELCQNSIGYSPLFLDIDKNKDDLNLKTVQNFTLKCLDLIEKNAQFLTLDSLRIVFSGRKGFHIEVVPVESVDNRSFRKYILCELNKSEIKTDCNKNIFENDMIAIDSGSDYVRVTGSYNSWWEDDVLKRRKVIQYTPKEFRKMQIEDIIARSEVT